MLLLFLSLAAFIASQATPAPTSQNTQYPALPNGNLILPALNKSVHVLLTGGKLQSISHATALIFWSLGATVTITTRNLKTFNYSAIAGTDINVMCLRLGSSSCQTCHCRPYQMAELYRKKYGKNPDYYVHGALTIYNGDPLDYTTKELDSIFREYYSGPLEIERVFLQNNNPNQKVTVLYLTTFAGIVLPPWYQTLYNERARFLLDRLEAQNAALRFANWEWLATLCFFTNTTAMINSKNPSATRAGLYSQQQFQTIFTANLYNLGYPPEFVGLAAVQAMLLRAQLGFETIFDASGVYSASVPAFIQLRATATGLQFTFAYRAISLNNFGINITDQTPPLFFRKAAVLASHWKGLIY